MPPKKIKKPRKRKEPTPADWVKLSNRFRLESIVDLLTRMVTRDGSVVVISKEDIECLESKGMLDNYVKCRIINLTGGASQCK